ncbi:MAG: cytochrome c3 family protein [Pseudomonadota bacterium]
MSHPKVAGLRYRRRQNLGFTAGLSLGGLTLVALLLPQDEHWHERGPMNTGHETLHCASCHKPAPGTIRQQLQAGVRHALGLRKTAADFGYREVTNEVCLGCHDRPEDRHPVFRFVEPRFAEARAKLRPQWCVSCHLEHQGLRVSLDRVTYCETCHKDTRLKKDPLDIPHQTLITLKQWESCLGCHDFHGNHVMKTRTRVAEVLAPETLRAYFAGAPSPYPQQKRYPAKKEDLHEP